MDLSKSDTPFAQYVRLNKQADAWVMESTQRENNMKRMFQQLIAKDRMKEPFSARNNDGLRKLQTEKAKPESESAEKRRIKLKPSKDEPRDASPVIQQKPEKARIETKAKSSSSTDIKKRGVLEKKTSEACLHKPSRATESPAPLKTSRSRAEGFDVTHRPGFRQTPPKNDTRTKFYQSGKLIPVENLDYNEMMKKTGDAIQAGTNAHNSKLEEFISQRCRDMFGESRNKIENLRFMEKHRLTTLYQQKAKIMKGKSYNKAKEATTTSPDARSPSKARQSRTRQNLTDRNIVEPELVATPQVEKVNLRTSTEEGRRAAKAVKIFNIVKMIDYLGEDKELEEKKQTYRDQIKEFRKSTLSSTLDTGSSNSHSEVLPVNDHERLKDFKLIRLLGDGSSSVVQLVLDIHRQKKYALKIFDKSHFNSSMKNTLKNEIKMLEKCNHPNIIKLIDSFEGAKKVYLLLEYVGPSTLAHELDSPKRTVKGRMSEDEAAHVFHEVAQGLNYLHRNGMAHRDVKLHNIIIGLQGEVKIIDLGYGIQYQTGQKISSFCGTPSYMSPEVISREPYDAFKADVWSFGVCLYKALTGKFPFPGVSQTNLFYNIRKGHYELPAHLSEHAKKLIGMLLVPDPSMRPPIQDILNQPWLASAVTESTADIGESTRL